MAKDKSKKKEALPYDKWEKVVGDRVSDDVNGSTLPPILCAGKTSQDVITAIEDLMGEFMWDVWDEAEILKPMVDEDRVGWAEIQYVGKPCRCCGNYSGTITYFDRNRNQLHQTDFSD